MRSRWIFSRKWRGSIPILSTGSMTTPAAPLRWANTLLPAWDHEARLEGMDRAGIDLAILSNPPIYSRVDKHAPKLCPLVNNALASACRPNPDRFKFFGHLP